MSAAVLFLCCAYAGAQGLPDFRARTEVVLVPVTVTDESGRFVRGLASDQFEVKDAGAVRPIVEFSAERVPVSLGVLLDISGSMASDPKARAVDDARWADTRRALELLVSRMDPRDEVFFAVFADKVALAVPWTQEHRRLLAAFDRLRPGGATGLVDAVKLIAPAFQLSRHSRKALLLISDGRDTRVPAGAAGYPYWIGPQGREAQFHATLGERRKMVRDLMVGGAEDALRKSEVLVYAIGMGTRKGAPVNLLLLQELAGDSGGYAEPLSDPAEIAAAVARMSDELTAQYVLAFEPAHTDGRYHEINVTTRSRSHRVRSRAGYVASGPNP